MTQPTQWDIHDLRHQGDLFTYLAAARAKAIADCKQRKTRARTDPYLAEQLIDVLRLASVDQWSGYLPPERDATGRPNSSPIRRALVEMLDEADRRAA